MNEIRSMDEALPIGRSSKPIYDGRIGPLAGITVSNAVFTFATLGVYRFWGKARLRRYLWSRVSFLGDRLEFTGRGIELFIGFLIALVFLVPLFGIPQAVQIFFPNDFELQGLVGFVQALAIYFLIPVALFRARRYRLTRTRWRGIRGGQTGSAFRYGLRVFAFSLLAGLSLMLAYPWCSVAIQRYKIDHTWFGDRKLSFHGRGQDLVRPWLLTWAAVMLGFGLGAYIIFRGVMSAMSGVEVGQIQGFGIAALFLLFAGGLAWVRYKVVEFRYFTGRTHLGEARFVSSLSAIKVVLIYALFAAVSAVLFFLVFTAVTSLFGAVGFASMMGSSGQITETPFAGQEDLIGTLFFVVFLVVFALVFGVVRVLFLLHPLTKAICGSLEITGAETFVELAQSRQSAPGRGEGLADALDVGEIGF